MEGGSWVHGKHAQYEALDAVCQFLHDRGFQNAFDALLNDAHHEYNSDTWGGKPNVLLNALQLYQDFKRSGKLATGEGGQQGIVDEEEEDGEEEIRKSAEMLLLDLASLKDVTRIPKFESAEFESPCFKTNVLAVRFGPRMETLNSSSDLWGIAGTVDKTLSFVDLQTGDIMYRAAGIVDGAILSVEFNPVFKHLVAISCMNGTHYVVNWQRLPLDGPEATVCKFMDHTFKYVLSVKWSTDGRLLTSTSNDHSVNVYVVEDILAAQDALQLPNFKKVKQLLFRETAESILWTPDSLVIGVRGDNYLNFYDPETLEKKDKLNMNTTKDDHVSFTPMHLTYSSLTRFIGVSTDKNRAILVTQGCDGPICSFYGATNDEYSTPRACFNHNGSVLFSTSQDNAVVGWEVATQRTLHRFEGHKKLIVSSKVWLPLSA
eukprot:TRINITY_DN7408_c0_g1_i3.p1 TRINITY_DN7408_c0_g1~~TRINITY_DN7408_c0_g1_i3.p1  ORF type:complete len:432 (-),score=120.57 TRINITY_DN7408_c0_g1_i3:245-1540(-)